MSFLSCACLHNNSKWCLPSLLVSPLAKWCFFHASCLHNSMYYCINRWHTFKREKSTLCNNFIQKRGVSLFSKLGLFSGDYWNTNTLQHWPQLTTSNILDYIGDFPAYIGKFQAQLIPPIMEMLWIVMSLPGHRRLQARAYLGIARVISNHAYSYHENRTWRHPIP